MAVLVPELCWVIWGGREDGEVEGEAAQRQFIGGGKKRLMEGCRLILYLLYVLYYRTFPGGSIRKLPQTTLSEMCDTSQIYWTKI